MVKFFQFPIFYTKIKNVAANCFIRSRRMHQREFFIYERIYEK